MESGNASARDLTVLLHAWREGQPDAREELVRRVYPQLRSLASRYLSSEKPGHTLNATGLVHEAFLKIVGADISWADRAHFFAISARVMRQILVDHAKSHGRVKRGGAAPKLSLEDAVVIAPAPEERLLDLDEALHELAAIDSRKAQLVEMVYFGGLSQAEAAEVLGVSEATVQRDLRLAKAWLYRALNEK
ncbi:MAG: sigma-70 family RNA polymerase sigma factor [Acidobacteriaceae bacterium]|nr:sigma-70 family RNA polymerase sigma factor [Acidobacteriaceae bacterium]